MQNTLIQNSDVWKKFNAFTQSFNNIEKSVKIFMRKKQ